MAVSLLGVMLYTKDVVYVRDENRRAQLVGIGWAMLNNFLAIGDRLLQRLMLGKEQQPVDISKTGVTLLNNLLGTVPLLLAAFLTNEFPKIPDAMASLTPIGSMWVFFSCVVGVGI